MGDGFKLMLTGGPADEVREARPRWSLIGPEGILTVAPDPVPDAVWLCRVEWPLGEWRVRLHSEPSRGKASLYWLERERDNSPLQAMDGAYLYAHVPDEEVDEFLHGAEAPPVDEYRLSTR